jgi:hypothetical protein
VLALALGILGPRGLSIITGSLQPLLLLLLLQLLLLQLLLGHRWVPLYRHNQWQAHYVCCSCCLGVDDVQGQRQELCCF